MSTSSLDAELDAVLALDPAEVSAQQRARFEERVGKRPLVLAGAGELGRRTLRALMGTARQPVAVVDNRATAGATLEGVPLLRPAEAAARYGQDAAFVVTVYNTSQLWKQLQELGCKVVLSYGLLYAAQAERLLPFMCLERTGAGLVKSAAAIREAFSRMADEGSRREFVAQLRARWLLGFDERPAPIPDARRAEEYFPDDVYAPREDEVLLDAGAYDGDTIRRFLSRRGGRFGAIYGLEPDAGTFARLETNLASLGGDTASRIRAFQVAAAAHSGSLSFEATGDVSARATSQGLASVPCERLDVVLAGLRPPTLVKMDLEGGEPGALEGARELIVQHAPVLAVCVYHRQDHLWTLPLAVAAMRPDYKLFVRAHAEACWDACFYAVPPSRTR